MKPLRCFWALALLALVIWPTPATAAQASGRTLDEIADEVFGILRYAPGRPILAVVRLNGQASARLVLDTGADRSIVSPRLLQAAGIDLSRPATNQKFRGVTSQKADTVPCFYVDLVVAGHRSRLLVAAIDYGVVNEDGVLGRDFLDRFRVTIDPSTWTVTLVPVR